MVFVGLSECCYCQHPGNIFANQYDTDRTLSVLQELSSNYYRGVYENMNASDLIKMQLRYFAEFQNPEARLQKDLQKLNTSEAIDKVYEAYGTSSRKINGETRVLFKTPTDTDKRDSSHANPYSLIGVGIKNNNNFYLKNNSYSGYFTDNLNGFRPDNINSHQSNLPSDTVADGNPTLDRIGNFPAKFLKKVNGKISTLRKQLDKQSKNYIHKLLKQESRLKDQFCRLDSNAAKNVFSTNAEKEYTSLLLQLRSDSTVAISKNISGEYYSYIDSLQTALSYLGKNRQLLDASKIAPEKVESTLKNLLVLQSKMQDADQIKQFIQQRKEQFKGYLRQFTTLSPRITKAYQSYNKQLFYYAEQVKAYRETLNDPDKVMKLAFTILNKVPAFTNFMKKNSILASIFNLTGTYSPSVIGQGLSTRDQVLASLQNRMTATGGPNPSSFVQQNIQSAQGVVNQLRDKFTSNGNNNGADIDVPNFHPNDQKTKSFLKRLQLGTDLQTVHGNYYFPATTDFGVSLGYKIDSKNAIGIGASFKMGWGKDINHINLSGQGASIRSFVDINIKKSFYASGGFEYNYQHPFEPVNLPQLKSWQQSGLVGISKKISLKTKFIKSMKTQLLWDFLSYHQIPRAQPLKFRVGYSF